MPAELRPLRARRRRCGRHLDRSVPSQPSGSTAAAIHIDYARDTLEELTALLQRWLHNLASDAAVLLARSDAPHERRLRDPEFRGLRRPATA